MNLTRGKAIQVRSDVSKKYVLWDRTILVMLSQLFYVGLAKLPQILYFGTFTPRTDFFWQKTFSLFHVFHNHLVKADTNYIYIYIYIFIWLNRTNENTGCSQLICEELHHRHMHMQCTNIRGKREFLFSSFKTFPFTPPGSQRWTFCVGNEVVKTEYLSTESYYCLTAVLICPEVKHFSLLAPGHFWASNFS